MLIRCVDGCNRIVPWRKSRFNPTVGRLFFVKIFNQILVGSLTTRVRLTFYDHNAARCGLTHKEMKEGRSSGLTGNKTVLSLIWVQPLSFDCEDDWSEVVFVTVQYLGAPRFTGGGRSRTTEGKKKIYIMFYFSWIYLEYFDKSHIIIREFPFFSFF